MKKIYSLLLTFLCFAVTVSAQSQMGEIRGKVIDTKTKKPMADASITIQLNGVTKATTLSEDDGSFIIKTLQPGDNYSIIVTYTAYRNAVVTNVEVISDQITFENVSMESTEGGNQLSEVVIVRKKPLVSADGQSGQTKTSKEIMALGTRNVNSIANTVTGVDSRAGATPNFRGARADGTAYYIDGVRVQGSTFIPTNAIDQIQVITGGTPAQYGDFTGGAIAINTKSASRNFQGVVEYTTASPFTGYLDNTQYNELQAGVFGPLKIINKDKGDKERVLLGFTLVGAAMYTRDPRPSVTDVYVVKDEKQKEINNNPLVAQQAGGFIPAGEYLTKSDLQRVDYRPNSAQYRLNLQGNFTYQPVNNINIRLGYQGEYNRFRNFSYFNSLMNSDKNSMSENFLGRTYVQLTQTFNNKKDEKDKDKKSLISNAFYSVRLSYERIYNTTMDADFGEDIFSYGYVGAFKNYSRPVYQRVNKNFGDTADVYRDQNGNLIYLPGSYVKQVGTTDTLLTFDPVSGSNRILANYTSNVYDNIQGNGGKVTSIGALRGVGGLANGDAPNGVYSLMWGSPGTLQSGYSKLMNETFALYVMSEASVASKRNPKSKHDLQFGFTYEQQFQRFYSVSGQGLYPLMRQLANGQFSGLNDSIAIVKYDANGVFQDTVNFRPKIVEGTQSTFDRNLREKLIAMGATESNGRAIDKYSRINTDGYDPSMYSLNMFSADELLNNGNSLVSYYGYDYLGNRVGGKPNLDRFLADPANRTVGAYQPIYTAAWLQDKFVFKDLIVRLGVRMDRFDANQYVLKDPYSLAPVYTAGDVRRNNTKELNIPGSIGDDYVVYVNNENSDAQNLQVSGFRKGNNWYDRNGNPVTDPATLYKSSNESGSTINQNTPYLVTPNQKIPTTASFKDYAPDVKFSPRIWFSFPISSTSQFFGTYDILVQRPTSGNISQIDDYFFMINRQGNVLNNPDLKMTQVTDYEIGFRQQIGNDAALTLKASYREFRNLIQLYRYVQAWPYDYTSFGNLDFSTVKSIALEYEIRDLGNVTLSANYQLQFAEGTGSNTSSSATLVQAGLPTLRTIFPMDFDTRHTLKGVFDFHYKADKEYNGPIVGGKKIFERAGINAIFNATSGRPYTQQTLPTPEAQSGIATRNQVKGTINGANLPAQFFTDINVDKRFQFRSENLNGKTNVYELRIFLMVNNLFNSANVLNVYRYTGSAFDDGYITSSQAESQLRSATNAQSLVDLYNVRVVNPGNFALPRITRIGAALYF